MLEPTEDGLHAIGTDPNAGDVPKEDEQSAEAIARPATAGEGLPTALIATPRQRNQSAPFHWLMAAITTSISAICKCGPIGRPSNRSAEASVFGKCPRVTPRCS